MSITAFSSISQLITLDQAIEMTTAYRNNNQSILKTEYQGIGTLPLSETFNRKFFDQLLAQDNCEGIRLYYGMDTESKVHIIAVGVNADNEDMIYDVTLPVPLENILLENSIRCPTDCPPESVLNS
jgi:hypothetical protein